ncbi:hypothetical protein JCM15765_09800 [Paradesulfitobacterium aromaticivorans]
MNVMPRNIVLLPLLLLIIFGFGLLLVKAIRPRVNYFTTWRNNARFAGLYLALLIVLVPIYYLLPDQGFMQVSEGKNLADARTEGDMTGVYDYRFPPEGNLDQLPGVYKNSSQKFKVDTNKLTLKEAPTMGYQILIARKDVDDSEIEVSTYVAPHVAGGMNFTNLVLPPIISVQNGMLSVQAPSQQQLEFSRFNADFTINQFKQVNQTIQGMSASVNVGWKVIYLLVPKSLEIDSGAANVQMVLDQRD